MTDLIKKTIIKNLYTLYKIKMVDADNSYRRPEPPYATIKIIADSDAGGQAGNYKASFIKSEDPRFRNDIRESLDYQPTASLSINAVAREEAEARRLAEHLHDYFKFVGRPKLDSINTTVVTVGTIANRTIALADNLTQLYTYGLDIRIRYLREIERLSPTIEEWKVKGRVGRLEIEQRGEENGK